MELWTLGLVGTLLLGFHLPVPINYFIPSVSATVFLVFSITRFQLTVCPWKAYVVRLNQGAAFAVALLLVYNHSFYQSDFLQQPNQTYRVVGEIANNQFPIDCQSQVICQQSLLINLSSVDGKPFNFHLYKPQILVRVKYDGIRYQKGNRIAFVAKLNRPLGYENKFGFNYAKWAFANGIYAKGRIRDEVVLLDMKISLSQKLLNKLTDSLKNYDNQAYFYPLLLAEAGRLSGEQKQQLQNYGLSHLFAISGLHIGVLFLVAGVFCRLLLVLYQSPEKQLIANILAGACIWSYVALIDFPIPATRAAILVTSWILLSRLNIHIAKFRLFSFMVVFTLMYQPTGVVDAGWWLSVSAVAGIFVFNHLQRTSAHNIANLTLIKLKHSFYFQWFISLWLIPVCLFWFSGFSLAGFWLNLIFIPVFCLFIIPVLFLAAGFMLLQAELISDLLFKLIDLSFSQSLKLSAWFSTSMDWVILPKDMFVFIAIAICFVVVFKAIPTAFRITSIVVTSGLIGLSIFSFEQNNLRLYVFDVGQGTSVLVYRNGKGILYDLGPVYASGFSATEAVIEPNLLGLGLTKLDKVVVSHQDSDHYGNADVIARFVEQNEPFHCPTQTRLWQQTLIQPLWPNNKAETENLSLSDNDKSCVLKITDKVSGQSALLAGDITRKIELMLVEKHKLGVINLASELLFSPHHGSKYSSSYPFLKAVNAKYLVHTAGVFNHFNFPTIEVINRGKSLKMKQFSTSNWGQLLFTFNAKETTIMTDTELNWLSPFWKKQNPFSFQVEIR